MSMEINRINPGTDRIEKARETVKSQNDAKEPEKSAGPHDDYISSESRGVKPSGLYRVGQDENGNKKVFFDDPKKAQSDAKPDAPGKIADTDKVDREIRELKEEKKKLLQQIKAASGDEKKTEELESKLAQVESELNMKDNDSYRKQHTEIHDM